ncbi:MAG: hypothetical protein AAF358_00735 [Pseudomonadota bacterium]
MSKLKHAAMGCALALSAAGAQAAQVKDGMKACADALVEQLAETRPVSSNYAMGQGRGFINERDRLRPRESFEMNARSATSHEVIARVDCIVNNRAEVLELKGLPLAAQDVSPKADAIR